MVGQAADDWSPYDDFPYDCNKTERSHSDRVCFTVQNKRESYHAFTQCVHDPSAPFRLSGFTAGVWIARAYLIQESLEDEEHWRGGHTSTIGGNAGQHCVAFMIGLSAWRRDAQLDELTAMIPHGVLFQGLQIRVGDHERHNEDELESLRRLRVFRIANAMLSSSTIRATIKRTSLWAERRGRIKWAESSGREHQSR